MQDLALDPFLVDTDLCVSGVSHLVREVGHNSVVLLLGTVDEQIGKLRGGHDALSCLKFSTKLDGWV